jgi:hypothetical protein
MAEAMALHIGKYAEKNGLRGELAQRIETAHKAETGESLNAKELAWLSSFSQTLPNLNELSSDRAAKLLAADYNARFNKNKSKGYKGPTDSPTNANASPKAKQGKGKKGKNKK